MLVLLQKIESMNERRFEEDECCFRIYLMMNTVVTASGDGESLMIMVRSNGDDEDIAERV